MALILKLIYIRRNYFLVEHIFIALYGTAALMLALLLTTFLGMRLSEDDEWLTYMIFLSIVLIIELIAFKRYYKQSWSKTIIKLLKY